LGRLPSPHGRTDCGKQRPAWVIEACPVWRAISPFPAPVKPISCWRRARQLEGDRQPPLHTSRGSGRALFFCAWPEYVRALGCSPLRQFARADELNAPLLRARPSRQRWRRPRPFEKINLLPNGAPIDICRPQKRQSLSLNALAVRIFVFPGPAAPRGTRPVPVVSIPHHSHRRSGDFLPVA